MGLEASGVCFLVRFSVVRRRSNQVIGLAYSTRPFLAANYVKIIRDPEAGITGLAAIALFDYDVSTFFRLKLTVDRASGSNRVARIGKRR